MTVWPPEHDIMVLEGAGSPGEVNLKSHDLVNMRMAVHAQAPVLLVGDIDRGGVYASFLGTWLTFTDVERRLLAGYMVNRFRGDASLLEPAHRYMREHTGVPVLGTIPYIRDLNIPEEDMAGFPWNQNASSGPDDPETLDIAVVMLRHVSNFTDFAPLTGEPDVRLRPGPPYGGMGRAGCRHAARLQECDGRSWGTAPLRTCGQNTGARAGRKVALRASAAGCR